MCSMKLGHVPCVMAQYLILVKIIMLWIIMVCCLAMDPGPQFALLIILLARSNQCDFPDHFFVLCFNSLDKAFILKKTTLF